MHEGKMEVKRLGGGGKVTIYVDFFCTVSHLRGKKRTYSKLRDAVLLAGRFSAFDVETARDGKMFTRLCQEPDLEVTNGEYPWTYVKLKEVKNDNGK